MKKNRKGVKTMETQGYTLGIQLGEKMVFISDIDFKDEKEDSEGTIKLTEQPEEIAFTDDVENALYLKEYFKQQGIDFQIINVTFEKCDCEGCKADD